MNHNIMKAASHRNFTLAKIKIMRDGGLKKITEENSLDETKNGNLGIGILRNESTPTRVLFGCLPS